LLDGPTEEDIGPVRQLFIMAGITEREREDVLVLWESEKAAAGGTVSSRIRFIFQVSVHHENRLPLLD